jgi:uncharacterized glyoxalase superfamily protein PhnB
MPTRPCIVPTLCYRNAADAIAWLCDAFGFERHMVVPGEGESIVHAQLRYRDSMIMLSSAGDDDVFGKLQRTPGDVGGVCTQSAYVVVPDADAHYERAKLAGAVIVLENSDKDYGGRGYTCLDLEGHVWSFGTYDPWAED